ncbi:MAG: hypothetical protein V1860_02135 [bacterium]
MFFVIFILILNILFLNSSLIGIFFGIIYFFINGKRLGKWIFPGTGKSWQILAGIFFIFSFFSLFGAIIYYFYRLDIWVIALLLFSFPWIIQRINKKWPNPYIPKNIFTWPQKIQNFIFFILQKNKILYILRNKILNCAYLGLLIILFAILFKSATADAIQSPWLIITKLFFIFYIIATLLLIAIILENKNDKLSLFFIILHTFLSASIALIVYKLGYGFDPFIHQATEKVIFEHGIITPKPLYYLGQYSLTVMFAKIFQLSVIKIDKLLVPVLFSIYIPSFIYFSFKKVFDWEPKYILLAALSSLLLPYTAFITATPQALANIYAIIIIFLSLIYIAQKNKKNSPITIIPARENILPVNEYEYRLPLILIFLTAVCLLIHPLTGLPAVIFIILLFLTQNKFKFRNLILFLISIFSAAALPFIFLINSFISPSLKIKFIVPSFQITNFIKTWMRNCRQYNLIRDFIYLYGFNIILFFLIIALAGMIIFYYRDKISRLILTPYLLTFFILIVNYLILSNFIFFKTLVSYEQNIYSQRILWISLYFLLPFFLIAFYYFFKKLMQDRIRYIKIFFFSFFALWLTASLYLTYPRYDNYVSDHGYNVSETDFKAVKYIDETAKSDYIVLANQNTSAAALTQYGFKKYYSTCRQDAKNRVSTEKCDEIFYYPIPTSSPLYQYYSDMVYIKPSRETMIKAMDLAGVKEGYFAVSDYWWQSDQIIARAKLEADEWEEIDGGKALVFKYNK